MFVPQSQAENEELRQELSELSAQHNSVLEENQRLRAKLENLEQVLKVRSQPHPRNPSLHLQLSLKKIILIFSEENCGFVHRLKFLRAKTT